MSKVTILLETTIRDEHKALGRKGQSYDQLIEEYRRQQQQQQQQATAAAVMVSK